MIRIPIIVGPTSTGKTRLAIELAKKFNYEIFSVDSRQMFCDMDIGTGKVPINADVSVHKDMEKWELNGVNIHGYDLITPDKYFSAYDFSMWALPKIRKFIEAGTKVMLVGGSGFFIDILTGNIKPGNRPLDTKLREVLEKKTISELQEELMSLNPTMWGKVDRNNPARLIRAIELSNLGEDTSTPLPYLEDVGFTYFGLMASREILYMRADTWVEEVWKAGLLEETSSLISSGYADTRPLNGLIYKSVKALLENKLDKEEAILRCKYDIHAYIRRQQTYFKRNKDIFWFDICQEGFARQISNRVQSL